MAEKKTGVRLLRKQTKAARTGIIVCCVAIAVALIALPSLFGGPQITTPLIDGGHVSDVQLSSGELHFMAVVPSNTDNVPANDPQTREETWTIKQLNAHMGRDFRPKQVPNGMIDTGAGDAWFVIFNKDNTVASDAFTALYAEEDGDVENPFHRELTVTASKGKLPPGCHLAEAANAVASQIDKHELYLTHYRRAKTFDESAVPTSFADMYQAEFLYKGIGYQVISENLTQKEIIDVLLSLL